MTGPALGLKDRIAIAVATGCGIGYSPFAPGTFGSVPGLLLGGLLHVYVTRLVGPGPAAVVVISLALVALVFIALVAIGRMEGALGIHDDQRIVVDEIAGQAIAVAFVSPALLPYVAGFVLFRLLDITKPSLIGKIDREVKGAWGTLGDDVLAGVVAAPLTYGVSLIWNLPPVG